MTKEEKIKEDYIREFKNDEQDKYKRFEYLKIWIDKFGWFSGTLHDVNMNNFDMSGHKIRPKSLQGIENNNSWIKIENEADLPREELDYFILYKNEVQCFFGRICDLNEHATHYQKIIKPKPPIY